MADRKLGGELLQTTGVVAAGSFSGEVAAAGFKSLFTYMKEDTRQKPGWTYSAKVLGKGLVGSLLHAIARRANRTAGGLNTAAAGSFGTLLGVDTPDFLLAQFWDRKYKQTLGYSGPQTEKKSARSMMKNVQSKDAWLNEEDVLL
jgi:hypothetical protein